VQKKIKAKFPTTKKDDKQWSAITKRIKDKLIDYRYDVKSKVHLPHVPNSLLNMLNGLHAPDHLVNGQRGFQ
jgi:hypothetical protein